MQSGLPLFDSFLSHFSFFAKPSPYQAVLLNIQTRQQLQQKLDSLNQKIHYSLNTLDVTAPLDAINQRTLLHWAAIQGNVQLFKELFDLKPHSNLEVKDVWQKTPLYYAVCNTHTHLVQLLLAQQVDAQMPGLLPEAFQIAAKRQDYLVIIQQLLQHNAPINSQDLLGNTLLHKATKAQDIELLILLLQTGGIRADIKNHDNKTAIEIAIQDDHSAIIQLLHHFENNTLLSATSIPTTLTRF